MGALYNKTIKIGKGEGGGEVRRGEVEMRVNSILVTFLIILLGSELWYDCGKNPHL